MSLQFGRTVTAVIGTPGTVGALIDGPRISFDVEKTDGAPLNTATVKIYNVSEDTAQSARERGTVLQLTAGYGESAGLIYLGEIQRSPERLERPDSILEIECGDGQSARGASVAVSRRGQNRVGDVLGTLARAAGLSVDLSSITGTTPLPAPRGISLHGPALSQINRVTRLARLDWTIEDGNLVVVPRGAATRLPAIVVSPDTGLIGSPRPTQGGRLVVKMLLNPEVRLRRILRVVSRDFEGWYLVRKIKHTGDSGYDGAFYTEAECTEIRPRR